MHELYENPLNARYASKEMSALFSDDEKFKTWRRLWVALAEAERELGLNITQAQIDELKAHINDINYEDALRREKEVRHDVMAHVYAYGLECPGAKPIIHLGATSCYVGDNADIIVMRKAIDLICRRLAGVLTKLRAFALEYKEMPTLGFTHFQPAQLTTVGKRACLWIEDLLMDLSELERLRDGMKLRGVKGTTGTQASFMTLFNGDGEKVKRLEELVCEKMGFKSAFPVTGQTYPRKLDTMALNALSLVAQSAYKFSNDMRLLQSLKEVEEPFEAGQIGSSAMAYKRNPMRCERMGALCRFVISLNQNAHITASTQWFERTLDDSANRRLSIPQAFLGVDGALILYGNVASGMVVYPKVIEKRINDELPFMATETILMEAVKRGGDRQDLHERIRRCSMLAADRVKRQGGDNNLLDLIAGDGAFGFSRKELDNLLDARLFTGRATTQVEEFIEQYVDAAISPYACCDAETEINV